MEMKEEALELADFLENNMVAAVAILGDVTATHIVSTIRRLVEELDKTQRQLKTEINTLKRYVDVSNDLLSKLERHGIK